MQPFDLPFKFVETMRLDFFLSAHRRISFVLGMDFRRESFGFHEQIEQFRFDVSPSLVGGHHLPVSRRQTDHQCPCRPPWTTFTGGCTAVI